MPLEPDRIYALEVVALGMFSVAKNNRYETLLFPADEKEHFDVFEPLTSTLEKYKIQCTNISNDQRNKFI